MEEQLMGGTPAEEQGTEAPDAFDVALEGAKAAPAAETALEEEQEAQPADAVEEHPTSDKQWEAARLKKDEQVRLAAERQAADRQAAADAEIARLCDGAVHPVTGEPISTVAEYVDALKAQKETEQRAQLEKAGVDPGLIDKAVAQHPAIVAAQKVMADIQRERGAQMLADQVAEISRLDPGIKQFDDLLKMENFEEFDRLARSGVSLVAAYKAANYHRQRASGAAAGKQAALNAVTAKEHLRPAPGGDGAERADAEIPEREVAVWREMFPDASGEELRRKYNKAIG